MVNYVLLVPKTDRNNQTRALSSHLSQRINIPSENFHFVIRSASSAPRIPLMQPSRVVRQYPSSAHSNTRGTLFTNNDDGKRAKPRTFY